MLSTSSPAQDLAVFVSFCSQDPLRHRGHLAQDGLHVVVSSQKQQNSAATLQGEGLSVTGTVCHVGKAEDWERLVDTMSCREMGKEPGGRKRSQPEPPSLVSWTALVRSNAVLLTKT